MADSIVDWVNEHVYNELRWLAVAGTTWQACRIGGSRALKAGAPPHLRVMALDSALVHGRSLFQFFCTEGGVDGKARLNCGVASPLASALYVEIKDELNTYLMHLGSGRSTGHARSPDRPHLKERVVEIVLEVDGLTGATVDILRSLSPEVADAFASARVRATKNGSNCAVFFGIDPIF